jgi:hypothetical protein
MPAPDYPRVPFPDWPQPAPVTPRARATPDPDRWWYEPPIEARIFDGILALDKRLAKIAGQIDRWPPAKVAEALDKGLIDGWPWTLTARGRAVFVGLGRR